MPRENPLYRAQLEVLNVTYPGRTVWTNRNICEYEQISPDTVRARYGRIGHGITTPVYAQLLATRQWQSMNNETKDAIREAAIL